ncbi:MAG: hypothetical protein AB7S70_01395 [Hyphomicrobium sp.]|uniref:hypothetical protein n=1 Tax=Hyphomicrobium sp. TaxID=82 RepID=UPI003D0B4612
MTTKIVMGLASVLVAATALTTAAEAGGDGVRLPFGYPLGSFKATPARGGDAVVTPRARKAYAPSKPAPRHEAAKAKDDKATTAAAEPAPATTNEAPPITGSSALIQSDIPAQATDTAEAPATGTEPAVTASSGSADTCRKFIPALGTTVTVACDR